MSARTNRLRRFQLTRLEDRQTPAYMLVSSLADSGPGSLRSAINDANTVPGADNIVFSPGLTGTITLTSELTLLEGVDFAGPGANVLKISGNFTNRIFNSSSAPSTSKFAVSGLTLMQGRTAAPGGAIMAGDETWTVSNCVFDDNIVASNSGAGGAIAFVSGSGGVLTVQDSLITGCKSDGGGGLFMYGVGAKMAVLRSSLVGNQAGSGGAIMMYQGGDLLVEGSTLSGNFAFGFGGGIYFQGQVGAGGFVVRNSTISSNTSGNIGGGIALGFFDGQVTIQNSTITANTALAASLGGGGIGVVDGSHTITLESSIVSNNDSPSTVNDDFYAPGTVMCKNSAIGNTNSIFTGVDLGGNLFEVDLKLGPLADNGGPTKTHTLLPGSPAIDKGSNPANLTTDQRGSGFPRTRGFGIDMGAVEATVPPPKVSSVLVNGGQSQRSSVTSLAVNFDSVVNIQGSPFALQRVSDGKVVGYQFKIAQTLTTTSALVEFTSGPLDNGSLADGRYVLTINAGQILGTGGNLDGDGDGTGGDNYSLSSTGAGGIFRLFGDANGDAKVDSADFILFRAAFNTSSGNPAFNSALDSNNDGKIDSTDFIAFRGRFNATV